MKKKILAAFAMLALLASVATAGVVSKPFTFTNNTVADANQVNSDFDTLYALVNGNIDAANLAAGAIGTSEIADNSVNFLKIDWGTGLNQVRGTETTSWRLGQGGANFIDIASPALTGNRTWTLQDSNDTFVGRATTDTLSNKSLTAPVITLPQINDTSSDHQYVFAVNELIADRTVTLPLLTGDDTFVFADQLQTLTHKNLTGPFISGTVTGSATYNAVTLTAADINGAAISGLQIEDTTETDEYIIAVNELAADRTLTLPLLGANDTFVFQTFAQSLSNKTLVTPTIASFANATHSHQDAAGGGTLNASAIAAGTLPVARGGTGTTTSTGATNVVLSDSPTIVTPTIASFANATHSHQNAAGGGTLDAAAITTGQLLLPAADPPTANAANRNSFVKAWAKIDGDGTILASYNIASVNHTATGKYTITFNTDFSSTNYAIFISPERAGGLNGAITVGNWVTSGIGAGTIDVGINRSTDNNFLDNKFGILAIGTQ